ncbi:MAG: hypothetical protein HFI09_01890 [Bacilli bacterium]|nr:hypothetical protein [Bacilli bacterium]
MDLIIDFLVGNYLWFLVITIVLIFALIGYIVDSKEHKEVSTFDSPQELARHLEMLAASAQNKTIGEAMNPQNSYFANIPTSTNPNIVNSMPAEFTNSSVMNAQMNNYSNQMNQNVTRNNSSFEVLSK